MADLLVQEILLFVYFFVVTSRFFWHDYPLDVFKALLHILSLLYGLALKDKDLLSLFKVWWVQTTLFLRVTLFLSTYLWLVWINGRYNLLLRNFLIKWNSLLLVRGRLSSTWENFLSIRCWTWVLRVAPWLDNSVCALPSRFILHSPIMLGSITFWLQTILLLDLQMWILLILELYQLLCKSFLMDIENLLEDSILRMTELLLHSSKCKIIILVSKGENSSNNRVNNTSMWAMDLYNAAQSLDDCCVLDIRVITVLKRFALFNEHIQNL